VKLLADITTRNDVEKLVNTFYDKVKVNPLIGHVFGEVADVDWDVHLPIMYTFWASILLGEQSYHGNPMPKHIQLSRLTPMTDIQFTEWLRLFEETVDGLFCGEKADDAKIRAGNIARLMQHKIESF
jgi:hemoglobin